MSNVNLDQARGVVDYPYNCQTCLSENISRGSVTGTYICISCMGRTDRTKLPYQTITYRGRTYDASDFVKKFENVLKKMTTVKRAGCTCPHTEERKNGKVYWPIDHKPECQWYNK